MTTSPDPRRETYARIIDPLCSWGPIGWKHGYDSYEEAVAGQAQRQQAALSKADAILALEGGKENGSANAILGPTPKSADTDPEWVLVPREPTREMVDCAQMHAAAADASRRGYGFRDTWLSMVFAATKLTTPPPSPGDKP